MRRIAIGITLFASMAFSSVQNVANISDLKESLVILIENQEQLQAQLNSIVEKQKLIENNNAEIQKQLSNLNSNASENRKKQKVELENLANENKKTLEGLSKEVENKLANLKRNDSSQDLDGLKNDLSNMKEEINNMQQELRLKDENSKNTQEVNLLFLDDYFIDDQGKVYSIKDLTSNSRVDGIDEETQKNIQSILKEMERGGNKPKKKNNKQAKKEEGEKKSISREDGLKILIEKINRLEKRLEWLEYKVDSTVKALKENCKSKDGRELILDFELK